MSTYTFFGSLSLSFGCTQEVPVEERVVVESPMTG